MNKIAKIIFQDSLKNKIVIIYFLMMAILSWTSLTLEDTESKSILTILNVVLFAVPLMTILFSSIYLYNSKEFIILLLSQPIKRSAVWSSLYAGLTGSLTLAFILGTGVPLLIYTGTAGLYVLIAGIAITLIFAALAFLTSIMCSDKAKGIGTAILIWLFFTVLYDGICLFLMFQFSDYPIDGLMMSLLVLNPIDIARLQVILKMDVAAMMGYSGAAFKEFFGQAWGAIVSSLLIIIWIVVPYCISLRIFKKKDM